MLNNQQYVNLNVSFLTDYVKQKTDDEENSVIGSA